MNYADRSTKSKRANRGPRPPRNAAAADRAREQGTFLAVSFIGDAPWPGPTVYCDSGKHYDWDFMRGLHTVVLIKPGIDATHALAEILERSDTCGVGFPALMDMEKREVAFVVDKAGGGVQLWPVRRDSDLWKTYFEPTS